MKGALAEHGYGFGIALGSRDASSLGMPGEMI